MNMVRVRFLLAILMLAGAAAYAQAPKVKEDPYALGLAQISAGNFEKAKVLLDEAVNQDPKNAKAWLQLGVVRGKLGDSDGRFAAYRRAIEIDPEYADAYYNLGLASLLAGKSCAQAEIEKLAVLNPELSRKLAAMITIIIWDPFGSGCDAARFVWLGGNDRDAVSSSH